MILWRRSTDHPGTKNMENSANAGRRKFGRATSVIYLVMCLFLLAGFPALRWLALPMFVKVYADIGAALPDLSRIAIGLAGAPAISVAAPSAIGMLLVAKEFMLAPRASRIVNRVSGAILALCLVAMMLGLMLPLWGWMDQIQK